MRRLLATTAFLAAFCLSGQPAWSQELQAAPDVQRVMDGLSLTAVGIQRLEVPNAGPASFNTAVVLGAGEYVLDLQPHSLRADGFRLLAAGADGLTEVAPPPARTFRGAVLSAADGAPVGRAAASVLDGKLTAMVALDDGGFWFVQPASDGGGLAESDQYAVYRSADVRPTNKRCGVDEAFLALHPRAPIDGGVQPLGGGDDGGPRATGYKVADVGFDADYEFYVLNGSSVVNTMYDIENVMNSVELIYERDTDLTFEMTTIIVRTAEPDPYTSTNSSTLLSQFRSAWAASPYSYIVRDFAHLMTGKELDGDVIGVSYLGSVCDSPTGNGYGLSQSRFTTNWSHRVALTTHEMGHTWDASHCDGNGDCHIMCSMLAGCDGLGLPNFGYLAISEITSFKSTRTCLFPTGSATLGDPIALPFTDNFTTTTVDANKWSYNNGATINTNGVSEPSPSYSLNLDCADSTEYRDDDIRTNFILMDVGHNVHIEYYTQHRGVEAAKKLIVEYWGENLRWITLNEIVSDGIDQDTYVYYTHGLTPAGNPYAFHNEFRLRFRAEVDQTNDDWYVDNVCVGCGDGAAPTPNPPTWASDPAPLSTSQVTMTSTTCTDASPPIYYYFYAGGGGHSRDYAIETSYIDSGITPNTSCSYLIRTHDSADPVNTSSWSSSRTTATYIETPTGVSFGTVTENSIDLQAAGTLTNLTAASSGVYFDSTTAGGDGGINQWVQVTTGTATPLSPDTLYTFQVKARNQNGIETSYSPTAGKATLANVPGAPTVGNPSSSTLDVDVDPNDNPANTTYAIYCSATAPYDVNWDGWYVSAAGTPSGPEVWQTDGAWGTITVQGLQPETTYYFAVLARNQEGVVTALGPEGFGTTTAQGACSLMGDVNSDGLVNGLDVEGFVRVKLGVPLPGDNQACANYGGTLEDDIADFITDLLGA